MRYQYLIAVVLLAPLARPAAAQLNLGAFGGLGGSMTSEGIAGFSETKFQRRTNVYGAAVNYRFRNSLSLGVRAEQVRLKLEETGSELGTLKMTPLMVTFGAQGRPSGRGFTGHGQLGVGIVLSKFENGPWIKELESSYGNLVNVQVTTKNAVMGEVGGGLDYFLSRYVSLTTDFRLVFGNIGTAWNVTGGDVSLPVSGADKFYASTWQTLGGIRIWLH